MKPFLPTVLLLILAAQLLAQTNTPPIDWQRAQSLFQRDQRGEKLNAEEAAYLDRAKKLRQQNQGKQQPAATVPRGEPFKQAALTDVKGTYKGQTGGLYGEGKNEPPAQHLTAAQAAAKQIQPLSAEGKPDAKGKVGLISIGMSNTTQEFSNFVRLANADPAKSDSLVLVDGAQGARDSKMWLFTGEKDDRGQPSPWTVLAERLRNAGVSPAQVQVLWLKQAHAGPASLGEFPAHARKLEEHLQFIVQHAKKTFPNLRIAYLSSRIYAGYANTPLNPEPFAFEGAFSVRWLIEKQINGDAVLNFDASKGEVKAPVLLWGAYLWTNGTEGRSIDDLKWTREDVANDGTHPSPAGQRKIAEVLLKFFKAEPTAKSWFLKPTAAK
ncbi:MAG: hypothetical protein K0Q55_2026 [Verrucomicrobia bacterium]|jgi:hypothetical protein|nr:hypothetical protein [Verrucomicrobiota bacterium]